MTDREKLLALADELESILDKRGANNLPHRSVVISRDKTETIIAALRASPAPAGVREALAPFIAYAEGRGFQNLPDDLNITAGSIMARRQLTVGDLRKLLAALSAAPVVEPVKAAHDPAALKQSHVLCFDDGILTIKTSGHDKQHGWGTIAFHDRQIEVDHDGFHIAEIPPSEFRAMRDFLNKHFPPIPAVGAEEIERAKKDGTPIIAKFHDDIFPRIKPGRDDLERWNGRRVTGEPSRKELLDPAPPRTVADAGGTGGGE